MSEEEVWLPVVGHDGHEVSSFGRVRSLDRCVPSKGIQSRRKGWVLSAKRGKHYPITRVGGKDVAIHRLVADAFIPNPEGRPQVNHIDGDKRNNHVSNLEWVTASQNAQHAYDTGLQPDKTGQIYGPQKTHCLRGHERLSSNLTAKGECRECRNEKSRIRRRKAAEQKGAR